MNGRTKKCVTCGTTTATRYRGMQAGRIRCANCYQAERRKIQKQRGKQSEAHYDMWER